MSLVNDDLTLKESPQVGSESAGVSRRPSDVKYLFCHIVPMLGRMDPRLEWGCPARGVHGCSSVCLVLGRLPIDQQRNSVFRLRNAVVGFAGGNASRGTCYYASGNSEAL